MSLINKIIHYKNSFLKSYFLSFEEKKMLSITDGITFSKQENPDERSKNILIIASADLGFFLRFTFFLLCYSNNQNSHHFIFVRNIPNERILKSSWRKLLFYFFQNSITERKAITLFKRFSPFYRFHSDYIFHDQEKANSLVLNLKSKIHNLKDLESLKIEDILIGDLIYDTYLRFNHSATVDISSDYLEFLIKKSVNIYLTAIDLFKKTHFETLLTSYTSYIFHGIITRVALRFEVKTYTMGLYNQLVSSPTKNFPFHKRNFHNYKQFLTQISSEEAISQGKKILESRFSGKIDSSTYYMKQSAFSLSETKFQFPQKTSARALILLHDFFDSPHVYGTLLFPDFLQWIEFIAQESLNLPYEFYVKPHPNGIDGNDEVIADIVQKYPHLKLIPKEISNNHLILHGEFDTMFTVYGTAAHEFSYKGIKSCNAGVNPHSAFDFCFTPETIDEFKSYIHHFPQIEVSINENEIFKFCYVHNYRSIKEKLHLFPFNPSPRDIISLLDSQNSNIEELKALVLKEIASVHQI